MKHFIFFLLALILGGEGLTLLYRFFSILRQEGTDYALDNQLWRLVLGIICTVVFVVVCVIYNKYRKSKN